MRSVALVLVVIGIAALVYGVYDYSSGGTTVEVGSMTASITEHGSRAIVALVAGGIAVIVGLALYAKGGRRT